MDMYHTHYFIFFLLLGSCILILLHGYKKIRLLKQKLKLQDQSLLLVSEALQMGIWNWNTKTNQVIWNASMYDIYDIQQDTLLTLSSWKSHHRDKKKIKHFLSELKLNKTLKLTSRIITANDEIRILNIVATKEKNTDMVVGIVVDITKQKHTTELLELEKDKLRNIIEGANIGTWEWHVQNDKQEVNKRWAGMLGYTIAELSPITIDTWKTFCHPDDLSNATALLQQHFDKKLDSYACDIRMKHKNGHWIWVHTRGKVARWSSNNKPLHMFGTHQDITLRKQHEEKIYQQANYDALTGLANRSLTEARIGLTLELAQRYNEHVGFLFIDLNKFKAINDEHGHAAGDTLLKEVAKRISSCIRKNDTASRVGGDEFLVILGELQSKANVTRVVESLIHKLSQPILINNITITIGVSIGIAAYPDDGDQQEKLIKLADEAMYKIKKTGKSGFGFAIM